MIKRILLLITTLALLCVMSACFPEPLPEPEPEQKDPTPEKYYYTLRLVNDNSDTIGINFSARGSGSDRALTDDVTQASHEFFEVVFYYNGSYNGSNTATSHKIARTTWKAGETPEISGVYGKGAGEPAVDYRSVRAPAAGSGAAVLFAGSKEDKTLLAVGHLSHVDNQPAGDTNLVGPNTTAVTFEVTALRAGASFNAATSSFLTDYGSGSGTTVSAANTTILNNVFIHDADKKTFPFYRLRHGTTTNAEYTFDIATSADYAGPDFAQYASGIVLAGGWNCKVTDPGYILDDGLYQYDSVFAQDLRSGLVSMTNNAVPILAAPAAPGYTNIAYFQNPVLFQFDTTDSPDGSIFALAFEIFVYNLTPRLTTMAGWKNVDPVRWRISPGMGAKWLDLDDGEGGEGGAILLGCGE